MNTLRIAVVAALAGTAIGQDSVSLTGGLPGDALSPFNGAQVRRSFVLDLSPGATSWGNSFGVAPLIKLSKSSQSFYNSLGSAQYLSQTQLTGVPYASQNGYELWNEAGNGVNENHNDRDGNEIITPSGASNQFSAMIAEFGTDNGGVSYNGIVGAVVNYDPSNPSRLFVTRVHGAVNEASNGAGDTAQFGAGSVDASGNVFFRADNFGTTGAPSISGQNWFAVPLLARNASANVIDAAGASDPMARWIVRNDATTHPVPCNIPSEFNGGQPLIAGGNFNGEFVRGSNFPATTDASWLDGATGGTRGGASFKNVTPLGGVGTMAVLGTSTGTTILNLAGVDGAGNVTGTFAAQLPGGSITDNCDGMNLPTNEFDHYHDQTAFRGGNGQVGVGMSGDDVLAGAVYYTNGGFNDDFDNVLAVARFDSTAPAATLEWSIGAWVDSASGMGKAILDGPGGASIGQITPLFNVTGGAPLGPSISAPTFDGDGNFYIVASVELFDRLPGGGSDFDSALLRGNYNASTFCWELELVAELGSVFAGQNSGTPWQISFSGVADANSVSSGTMWSGNANDQGVVLNAEIVYDRDGDGDFDDPTGAGGDPTSLDEAYNALLYFTHPRGDEGCPADWNGDTVLDIFDVLAYLADFDGGAAAADLNGDTVLDIFDVLEFLGLFDAGC